MSTTSPPPLPHHTNTQIQLPPRTLSAFIRFATSTSHTNTSTSSTTTLYTVPTSPPPSTPTKDKGATMHTRRNNQTVTRTTKPTLMTRLRGRNAKTRTTKTTTTVQPTTTTRPVRTSRWGGGGGANRRTAAHSHTTTPVVRQRRHATMGDKISGAMMKIKGSLTRRPGVKAAGTRRMRGTDGNGSHRVY